jgi:hypothetical protein
MSTTLSTWVGWWRAGPSALWERVVETAEIGECHRELLAVAAGRPERRRDVAFQKWMYHK